MVSNRAKLASGTPPLNPLDAQGHPKNATVQKCYIFNFRDWITPQCRKIKNLTFAKPPVWAPQWLSGCGALGSVRSVVSTGGGLSMASCWGFLARCWLLALVCCFTMADGDAKGTRNQPEPTRFLMVSSGF